MKGWTASGESSPRGTRAEGSEVLDGALGQQHLHGGPLDVDLHLRGDLERNVRVADLGDAPDHAAGSHHLVALLERFGHGLVLLGPLGLRADEHEVEKYEHQHDGQESRPACLASGHALRVREGYQHSSSKNERPAKKYS